MTTRYIKPIKLKPHVIKAALPHLPSCTFKRGQAGQHHTPAGRALLASPQRHSLLPEAPRWLPTLAIAPHPTPPHPTPALLQTPPPPSGCDAPSAAPAGNAARARGNRLYLWRCPAQRRMRGGSIAVQRAVRRGGGVCSRRAISPEL